MTPAVGVGFMVWVEPYLRRLDASKCTGCTAVPRVIPNYKLQILPVATAIASDSCFKMHIKHKYR